MSYFTIGKIYRHIYYDLQFLLLKRAVCEHCKRSDTVSKMCHGRLCGTGVEDHNNVEGVCGYWCTTQPAFKEVTIE